MHICFSIRRILYRVGAKNELSLPPNLSVRNKKESLGLSSKLSPAK